MNRILQLSYSPSDTPSLPSPALQTPDPRPYMAIAPSWKPPQPYLSPEDEPQLLCQGLGRRVRRQLQRVEAGGSHGQPIHRKGGALNGEALLLGQGCSSRVRCISQGTTRSTPRPPSCGPLVSRVPRHQGRQETDARYVHNWGPPALDFGCRVGQHRESPWQGGSPPTPRQPRPQPRLPYRSSPNPEAPG